jgi:hypothetical protein
MTDENDNSNKEFKLTEDFMRTQSMLTNIGDDVSNTLNIVY